MADFDSKAVDKHGKEMNVPTVLAAGEHTMASGDEDITIVGLKATDIALVSLHTQDGSVDIADLACKAEADNLNITATVAGSGTGVVSYVVLRP